MVSDLERELRKLLDSGVELEKIVVVEEHPAYPGELVFQPGENETGFYSRYRDWMSQYLVLNELFNYLAFTQVLLNDGYHLVSTDSSDLILDDLMEWQWPLEIEGYELHPFQQYSLQRAIEADFWFFNWATGAGKSFVSAAGAKLLFDQGLIDRVIFCTEASSKLDQIPFFVTAKLEAVVNDGTKTMRRKEYAQARPVYIMNYEKLWHDYDEIEKLCASKRVLFVFDEVTKIITAGKQNKAREAFEKLWKVTGTGSRIWPMTASAVDGNPLRYRDLFSLGGRDRNANPLGTRADFERRYASSITPRKIKNPRTGRFVDIAPDYEWNMSRLEEIRHRVGDRTHAVRKSDPGVREYFKDLATILIHVQSSPAEKELSQAIVDRAYEAWHREENLGPYYSLLRYVCNYPQALLATDHEVGKEIAKEYSELLDKVASSKLEKLNDKLVQIREQGDKVLVFTHWTTLTLHLIKDQLQVPYVLHYGTGMTEGQRQVAKERFRGDPDITCFFTSDAGKKGLNMQVARYCLQLEPTYSYDDNLQRQGRIHRSDSYLDDLTNYVMITDDSVEERVWAMQQDRREISAAVQGTVESLSHGDSERVQRARRSEQQNMAWLLFGDRA